MTRLFFITLALLLPAGCVEERVVRDDWATLRELADRPTPDRPVDDRPPTSAGYAILLKRFEGAKREQQAERLAKQLMDELFIPDIWVRDEGKAFSVYRGRYPEPSVDAAQRDLRQSRMLQLDGKRPFVGSALISLEAGGGAAQGPLDLKQHVGMYSLQIGFYDKEFGPEFRQAAEKAAKVLRDEGAEAYYYHGRHLSLVTVGVFSDADIVYVDNVATYGPRVAELQKKYPYNLANGVTIVNTLGDQKVTQPSFLVKVE
ncbi:MAG: hypothetical protein K8S99_11970 [Planctomycetes bacterium]|nr:hypothetical protein [Planctomycetota bacterium]